MAIIEKYQLNTHFTALKQLPDAYSATISFGGSYGYSIARVLAITTITVPAGSYVEISLMRSSIDGSTNWLTHEFVYNLNSYAYIVFSLNQTSASTYELKVALTNTSETVIIPQSTLTAILRLATSPFAF